MHLSETISSKISKISKMHLVQHFSHNSIMYLMLNDIINLISSVHIGKRC